MASTLQRFRLDGRRALITGGARGLGRVIADAFAEAGADIAIVGRSLEACQSAAAEIERTSGRRCLAFSADVSQADQVERLASDVEERLGPIDVLVNSAGVNLRGNLDQLSESDWDTVIDTNLKAPWLCAKRFGRGMCERGWGRVVNLGSVLGTIALAGRTPYCSSKAGILGLTRVLALEWAGSGVTANALCPGVFGTDMNRPLMDDPQKYREFMQRVPMGRWGELPEIAGPALFLASDASSYVTGSALFVDGGWSVW